jgi:aspartyl-tRNA(Asn)/glutamyl-tRNA(Gln) amidotransferase subunit A
MAALWQLSAVALRALLAAGKVSPVEVAQAVLAQVERINPTLNAVVWCDPEQVLADAGQAERVLRTPGAHTLPLLGIPFTVKDLLPVAGQPHTLGLRSRRGVVATETATSTQRLIAAGAIVLGRTNTSELGYSPITDNHLFGPTANPWRSDLISGGSSGGAAAAVAAGLGPLAQGTDGAGSIRIPASACGVFGMKPSLGRVPLTMPLHRFATFACEGPISRTVADAALMLRVMSGPAEDDPLSLPMWGEDRCTGDAAAGTRFAWSPDLGFGGVAPAVAAVTESAAAVFADLGGQVQAVPTVFDSDPQTVMWEGIWTPAYAGFGDLVAAGDVDEELVKLVRGGRFISARTIAAHEAARSRLVQQLARLFNSYDFLLTPTLRLPPLQSASRIGFAEGSTPQRSLGWLLTYPFNLTGNPVATVPCGWTGDGVAVGLQIVGRRLDDAGVLRVAADFEHARPWAHRWPPAATDARS